MRAVLRASWKRSVSQTTLQQYLASVWPHRAPLTRYHSQKIH